MVGAVVVRAGTILAEAWHDEFGAAHAEVLALAAASDARGSTVYASLEPCAHAGKTPPCTDALLAAGVARVVYWAPEPGRRAGGGAARLRASGVRADGPFGAPPDWAAENPFFFHRRARPYVALKLAISADARIAPPGGRRAWITGPAARREGHRIRAGFDAILVGAGTWRADDPRLTVRGPVAPRIPPARILLDHDGEVPLAARALERSGGPALVAVAPEHATAARARLGRRAEIVPVPPSPPAGSRLAVPRSPAGTNRRRLDVAALFASLRDRGVSRVLCEGGGRLAASLLAADHVDRAYVFLAPRVVGAAGVPAFPEQPSPDPADGLRAYVESMAARPDADPGPPPAGWRVSKEPVRLGPDALVVLDKSA